MSQPVTTNPWLIMLINMTVVFAVLFGLSLIIKVTKYLDPTKKKNLSEPAPVEIAEAAPVTAASATDDALVAVIAAAITAYGHSADSIRCIRPLHGDAWRQAGKLETIGSRTQLY